MFKTIIVSAALTSLASPLLASPASAQTKSGESLLFIGKAARVEAGRSVDAAVVVGEDLEIAGAVDGIAAAVGGDVHVLPGARVDGVVLAVGGTLRIDDGAKVDAARVTVAGGDFSQVAAELSRQQAASDAARRWVGPVVRLAQMLALFVFAMLLVTFAPRHVQGVRRALAHRPAYAALIGVLVMVASVPMCLLLAVSLVGFPLIPIVSLALIAAAVLGLTAFAAALGFALPVIKNPDNLFGAMAIGVLALTAGTLIPLLGTLTLFFATACGIGAVILSRFGSRPPSDAPSAQSDRPGPSAGTAVAGA